MSKQAVVEVLEIGQCVVEMVDGYRGTVTATLDGFSSGLMYVVTLKGGHTVFRDRRWLLPFDDRRLGAEE